MFKQLTRMDANYQKNNIYNLQLVQMIERSWTKRELQNSVINVKMLQLKWNAKVTGFAQARTIIWYNVLNVLVIKETKRKNYFFNAPTIGTRCNKKAL